jgi:glutamate-1-semialdehyde 2,1-aminomutase
MAAGIATLDVLRDGAAYEQLEGLGAMLADGLAAAAHDAGVTVSGTRVGSALTTFFTPRPPQDYANARTANTTAYGVFFRAMLEQGVYLAPSQFEAAFVSLAHTPADIEATVAAARTAFGAVRAMER